LLDSQLRLAVSVREYGAGDFFALQKTRLYVF